MLRQYGWAAKYRNELAGGRNSRLDELQAAFLEELLPDLEARNRRRRAIADRYSQEIHHALITAPAPAGEEFVAHLYVITSPRRDALRDHLHEHGIGSDIHYPVPDHRQPMHGERFRKVHLPVTDSRSASVLTLPCFPEMQRSEVDSVIAACNAWTTP